MLLVYTHFLCTWSWYDVNQYRQRVPKLGLFLYLGTDGVYGSMSQGKRPQQQYTLCDVLIYVLFAFFGDAHK